MKADRCVSPSWRVGCGY